ncbi:MAG: glycosyl hydrolase 115 family protein [Lachnospiraceae bacterium]|nr:glycosyl hydrolase 115 family protein [Lachnospiraceae bacterium]
MDILINYNTDILGMEKKSQTVCRAVAALRRDMNQVFQINEVNGADIFLVYEPMEQEQFSLQVKGGRLEIHAGDDLGFVYGIYEISRTFLEIPDFWFWMDSVPDKKEEVHIKETYRYQSGPCAVKYRGWFINDEVLLHTWSVERQKDKPWEMAFETLLRCRGNTVIPGTDRNAEHYRKLASEMGLYIAHHHAEPLGAEMFARAYPELNPSYAEYPDKFQKLWRDALEAQKDMNVVWNLGFRGQGDCPFWANDPQYATDEARGALLGSLIQMQYDMVKGQNPEAVCSTNLYGEIMELYKKDCLKLPDDIIKVWADNGYGKMVSRRQNNHNPRVPALPQEGNTEQNGIYYHVSFYDLQAANHITMFPNSAEFVVNELDEVLQRNGRDLWLINCSNIKPHVYFLDLIAQMWREGGADANTHCQEYAARYYGGQNGEKVAHCLSQYADYAVQYGIHEDEHAGEQFANHVARMLVSQLMRNAAQRCGELMWATDAKDLKGQALWYGELCEEAVGRYSKYLEQCERVQMDLTGSGKVLFADTILLQAKLLYGCYRGAMLTARSVIAALEGSYQESFYLAGKARKEYLSADEAMRVREHGKWHNFYENECLADVKQTAWVLEGLMSYVRNLGDGPHFYEWQREFLYPEEDRRVLLILNMDNHLRNLELFRLMEEKWDEDFSHIHVL